MDDKDCEIKHLKEQRSRLVEALSWAAQFAPNRGIQCEFEFYLEPPSQWAPIRTTHNEISRLLDECKD